jgi:hypothetical protein
MDQVCMAHDMDKLQAIMNGNEPSGCLKCKEFLD